MIKVSIDPRVYKDYHGLLRAACDWLRETQRIPHRLNVTLFTDKNMREFVRLVDYPEKNALGIFFLNSRDIIIRQRRYENVKVVKDGRKFKHRLDRFLYVIMHEFAHYEQFRDGKELSHRNIESRGMHLVRQFKDYWHEQCSLLHSA
ncbi:MAG: hypothetical protein WC315_00200 [Candidatus Omnitrophota bacterium]|jgi:hypothetical protein